MFRWCSLRCLLRRFAAAATYRIRCRYQPSRRREQYSEDRAPAAASGRNSEEEQQASAAPPPMAKNLSSGGAGLRWLAAVAVTVSMAVAGVLPDTLSRGGYRAGHLRRGGGTSELRRDLSRIRGGVTVIVEVPVPPGFTPAAFCWSAEKRRWLVRLWRRLWWLFR